MGKTYQLSLEKVLEAYKRGEVTLEETIEILLIMLNK